MRKKKSLKGVFRLIFIFFLNFKISSMAAMTEKERTTTTQVKVGVVLDMDDFGKMSMSCISMALSDFYVSHTHYKTRVILHTINSKGTVVDAAAAALEMIEKEEVQAIIGPQNSMQANFMIEIGDKAHVPIISFSATRPSLTSHRSSFFFRASQNDSSQVKAIGAIVKAFKWRQVVPIYVDNEFGEGIIPYLIDALQEVDAKVPYQSLISPKATDEQIAGELYKLMTMQTRVFVVHMLPYLASRLFTKAKEIGMMKKGYVWIMTDGITNELRSIKASVFESMQGVIGIKTYIPRSKRLKNFKHHWRRRLRKYYPTIEDNNIPELNVFGLWAYDAAWAGAMAVEHAGTNNLKYDDMTTNSSSNYNVYNNFGVNRNGPKLRDALLNQNVTSFKGLAGEFSLKNGQLKPSVFQIVNVRGNGARNIGRFRSAGRFELRRRRIMWPGSDDHESYEFEPKGWEIPTNGKKLRIGVPVNDSFVEFVNVVFDDSNTHTYQISGYCIDVFKAVIEALPYDIAYEFIPYPNTTNNRQPAGSYDDLTYQVYLGKFDAAVGDITIRANRSSYIDYTLPFTESGVSMVVPVKGTKNTNAWVFLKPLALNLWLTTGFFFVFMAFVVWILEHRVNDDFRGHPWDQICTSLWYSFSTMVFAHSEVTLNNWTRFVVIIWLFVVLIITQSYTASLASLLTVQELKPTATDINQLLVNGDNIGYQKGSFVYGILKSLKFDDSKLKTYNSAEEMNQLFDKGSNNGGISAAVDEIPYIRLFMAKYCEKYTTTTEPTYKAVGFGFVFPMGSPLVPDISRAVLNVTEGERMKEIENAWFRKVDKCPNASKTGEDLSSSRLSIDSFWGLFLITGIVSLFSCVFYIAKFLYYKRRLWIHSNSPIRKRFCDLLSEFIERDVNAHTLRRRLTINSDRVHPEGDEDDLRVPDGPKICQLS